MSEEYSLRFAEYAVAKRATGKNRVARTWLWVGYVAFAIAFIIGVTVPIKIPQLIALLPLLEWILFFFTRPLVKYDLCVRVESGRFTVTREARFYKRLLAEGRVKEATMGGAVATLPADLPVLDLRGDPNSPDGWFLVWDGRAVLFEATKKVTSVLRYYAPETGKGDAHLRY